MRRGPPLGPKYHISVTPNSSVLSICKSTARPKKFFVYQAGRPRWTLLHNHTIEISCKDGDNLIVLLQRLKINFQSKVPSLIRFTNKSNLRAAGESK